jgi:two-component system chemotaxis response regulator CheY
MQKVDKKWILIVDDENELRELLTHFLELQLGEKVRIMTAQDGADATAKVRNQAYDCIITDLRMPVKEGRAFVEAVNQSPLNQNTPIIVLTGYPDADLLKRFPMCTLLEKPASPETITQLVSTQLRLGRTDRRVGAHVLNSIIEATHKLLEQLLQIRGNLKMPEVKRAGEPFQRNCVRFVSCKIGSSAADFAFAASDHLLKELDKAATKGQGGHADDKVLLAATSTVLNSVAKLLDKASLTVARSDFYKGAQVGNDLTERKGIIIPLDTPYGRLEVLALC